MRNENRCGHSQEHRAEHKKCGRRPSSFWMHDPERVFLELNLQDGEVFLDLGCGAGDYALEAAKHVGEAGVVYALDMWRETVDAVAERAAAQGVKHITAMKADITGPLHLKDHSVDVCFIATVLHAVDIAHNRRMFGEMHRVLKPGGRLVIIECKKENMEFGPPKYMRLSPEELAQIIRQYGFAKTGFVDLGYNYMLQFAAN